MAQEFRKCPAAGRSFKLGTLYDCRSDTIIKGLTLWDKSELEHSICSTPNPENKFSITCDDSFEKKASSIGVKGELKLSLLAGLLGAEGLAEFVRDRVTVTNQARVVMNYSCTTRCDELSMENLAPHKITYKHVLTNGLATHVVVGIDYGADAHFVFDSKTTTRDGKDKLTGLLKAALSECVSSIANISGNIAGSLEGGEENLTKRFECTYYGDFKLPKNPASVEKALEIYKMLPVLLGSNEEKAVAKTVHLLPLNQLDDSAARFVREVKESIVHQSILVCETLITQQRNVSEIMANCPDARKILAFDRKISSFTDYLQRYSQKLSAELAVMLPKVRGGEEDESELEKILSNHNLSPFNGKECDKWIKQLRTEVRQMNQWMSALSTFDFEQYDDVCITNKVDLFICFLVTVKDDDEFLARLKANLENEDPGPNPPSRSLQHESWNAGLMRKRIDAFTHFATASKERPGVKFIVVENEVLLLDSPGFHTALYLNDEFQSFELHTTPRQLRAIAATHNSVTLDWQPPECGFDWVESYDLKCSRTGSSEILIMSVNKTSATVFDLVPDTKYSFVVRCVAAYGTSEDSNRCEASTESVPVLLDVSSKRTDEPIVEQTNELRQNISHSNALFVIGGAPEDNERNFFAYDISRRSWETLPNLPWFRRSSSACTLGGRLIVMGGRKDGSWTVDIDEYDLSVAKWSTSKAKLNAKLLTDKNLFYPESCADKQFAYAVGCDESGTRVERYDGNSCTMLTEDNPAKFCCGALWTQNHNAIFVVKEHSAGVVVEKYDMGSNKWTTVGKPIVRTFERVNTSAALLGDELYLVDSDCYRPAAATVRTLNICTEEICTISNLSSSHVGGRAVALDPNVVCVLGGCVVNSEKRWKPHASVEAFDVREGKWTGSIVPDMPKAAYNFVLVKI